MRVEEAVGRRVATLRERSGMSQSQLGELLGELLGNPWPRQTVSSAEKGGRKLTAVELFALAHVLGVHVAQLFVPPPELDVLELPGGWKIDGGEIRAFGRQPTESEAAATSAAFAEIGRAIRDYEEQIGRTRATTHRLRKVHEVMANSIAADTEEANA